MAKEPWHTSAMDHKQNNPVRFHVKSQLYASPELRASHESVEDCIEPAAVHALVSKPCSYHVAFSVFLRCEMDSCTWLTACWTDDKEILQQ